MLHFVDSQMVLGAVSKGRSSSSLLVDCSRLLQGPLCVYADKGIDSGLLSLNFLQNGPGDFGGGEFSSPHAVVQRVGS